MTSLEPLNEQVASCSTNDTRYFGKTTLMASSFAHRPFKGPLLDGKTGTPRASPVMSTGGTRTVPDSGTCGFRGSENLSLLSSRSKNHKSPTFDKRF